jgi:hypothetical protein
LTADIDLSAYGSGWNGGKGWIPIGADYKNPFGGTFDGNGKTVRGLYINNSSSSTYAGLFGYVSGGAIKNLGVANVDITGGNTAGGVAGYVRDNSEVENCYVSSGTVSGGYKAGGVAGEVYQSRVKSCYSAVAVIGNGSGTGGVVGSNNSGTIESCAALNSSVIGGNYVGRVAGSSGPGTLTGNYAFAGMTVTSGGADKSPLDIGATGIDGADMTAAEIIADGTLGGLFANDGNPWTTANGKLPGFGAAVAMPAHISGNEFAGGGTEAEPYLIETAADLARLATLVNAGDADYNDKHYLMMNNISLSAYGSGWNGGAGWIPIGASGKQFKGVFDGGGKIISGLYINVPSGSGSYGLFDYVSGGTVRNLGLESPSVTGGMMSNGGVVANLRDNGLIERCFVSGGNISGQWSMGTGGIAGYVFSSSVKNCYTVGVTVGLESNSNESVGGIVGGISNGGTVENCYVAGGTVSDGMTGGSLGGIAAVRDNDTEVKNCVALNVGIKGGDNVGRVVNGNYYNMSVGGLLLENNYAFAGMTVTINNVETPVPEADKGHDKPDGADITVAEINADGTLKGLFAAAAIWTTAPGKLPGLAVFGSAVDMPAYLVPPPSPATYK